MALVQALGFEVAAMGGFDHLAAHPLFDEVAGGAGVDERRRRGRAVGVLLVDARDLAPQQGELFLDI